MTDAPQPPPDGEIAISLVRGDVLFRAQRAFGLIPKTGLGLGRRTLFYVLLTWLPLTVWAVWKQRALPGQIAEPLLAHYGIHVQLLLALPALILGEGVAHFVMRRLVPHFVVSGVVSAAETPHFREIVQGVAKLRDSIGPWVVLAAVVIAGRLLVPKWDASLDDLSWAAGAMPAQLGFGGWWYLCVAQPVFQIFLFAWLWRVVLLAVLLRRTARLNLQLAPLHPDRAGGLGFTEGFAVMFAPFAFACSALLSAHWAHLVIYHGARVASFRMVAIVFAVAMSLICLAPLTAFIMKLARANRQALLDYGALVGKHSQLVHRRWIAQDDVGEPPLLDAPELGPVADVGTLYEAVKRTRILPIGKQAVLGVVLPIMMPLLVLFAIEVPVRELLGKIIKGLL